MKKVFSNSIYIIANWSFHDSKVRIKNKIGLLPSYREFSTLKTIIYMYKYVQGSLTEKKTDQCMQCPVLNVQSEPFKMIWND